MTLGILLFCSLVTDTCASTQKVFETKEQCELEVSEIKENWVNQTINLVSGKCEVLGTDV